MSYLQSLSIGLSTTLIAHNLIYFHSLLPQGHLPTPSVFYPLLRAGSLLAALGFPLQLPSSHAHVGFICAWWINPRCLRQPSTMAPTSLRIPLCCWCRPAAPQRATNPRQELFQIRTSHVSRLRGEASRGLICLKPARSPFWGTAAPYLHMG